MKRQQHIRSGIIIGSFLTLPITQFYFSPHLIVWGTTKGIVTASFFSFAVLLLVSLFFGSAFCGWAMPCAGMQETFFGIIKNRPNEPIHDYRQKIEQSPEATGIKAQGR